MPVFAGSILGSLRFLYSGYGCDGRDSVENEESGDPIERVFTLNLPRISGAAAKSHVIGHNRVVSMNTSGETR